MNISDLDDKYGQYGFIKSDLEYLLGFDLNSDVKPLPDYLYPYKTRFGITIKESANIMAGFKPMDNVTVVDKAELFHAYLDSLWDAVDNGLLNATKIEEEYYNDEKYRVNAILIKDEVTIWAEKNNIQWPFGVEERSGGGEKTKESTDDIIKRLMAENEKLKNEISEVRELLPILLKTYRDDDPLTLEIEIRRENWINYDPDNDRATRDNQEAIVHYLETKGFTNRQASSIEMVACPIKRWYDFSKYLF